MKKLIAIITTLMMVMAMVPSMAFAAYEPAAKGPIEVNGVYYSTLEEAVNAANDDDWVLIKEDITLDKPIDIQKRLNFDGWTGDHAAVVTGSNGFFKQSGKAEYGLYSIDFYNTGSGSFIEHNANGLVISDCRFSSVDPVESVVKGLNSGDAIDPNYSIVVDNSTVVSNAKVAFDGIGNNVSMHGNIIDLKGEKFGTADVGTCAIKLVSNDKADYVNVYHNVFANADVAINITDLTISSDYAWFEYNRIWNVKYGLEVSPTANRAKGPYWFGKNHYKYNDKVSRAKIKDGDKGTEYVASVYGDPIADVSKYFKTDKALEKAFYGSMKLAAKTKAAKKGVVVSCIIKEGSAGDIVEYQVYRATKKNGKYKKVYQGWEDRFVDKKASKGKKYYYKVRGVAYSLDKQYFTKFSAPKVGKF